MRKYIFIIILFSQFISCSERTKDNSFNPKGMNGRSVFIYYINPMIGNSFNYSTHSEKQTEQQLSDSNFIPTRNSVSNIYKTIDGGKNWANVYTINNATFYNNTFVDKIAIYIQINNISATYSSRLAKYDFITEAYSLLDFNFEHMGIIWGKDKNIYVNNSNNNNNNNIYKINSQFRIIDSTQNSKVFKSNVVLMNNEPYVLTWSDEIYSIENNKTVKLRGSGNANCIVKKDNLHLVIAHSSKSAVTLYNYNIKTGKEEFIKEIKGYSIVKDLYSYKDVICGFIGNIIGFTTEYDLLYSLDQGKTWNIKSLNTMSVSPNCFVNNTLIYGGSHFLTKISFN